MTVESWVKFSSYPGSGLGEIVASKYYGIGGVDDRSWYLGLYNNSGTYQLRFQYSTDGTFQSGNDTLTNWTPSLNTWYHIAAVYDHSSPNVKFYVNGTQQGSTFTTSGTSIYNSSTPLYIGALRYTSDTWFLDGQLDDIRIWNVARSATDISNNMNNNLTGTESGLVAYYPFEPLPPLQNKITYYNSNDGTSFSRSASPITSGVATQTANTDGSVTVSINNVTSYADSGFDLYEGTLGNLPDFTVSGTGDQYGLNVWLDTGGDNDFFAWNSGVETGLNGDTYALGPASSSGTDAITGSSQFYLLSDGQNHTLSDLRNGNVSGISSSTKVAVWVGVNTSSGSKSATINTISGL
jgi:Concanavalin A-like lectin/glucanases superfamily